jgi:hypothetical protein
MEDQRDSGTKSAKSPWFQSKKNRVLLILLAACVGGITWRMRGDGALGGVTGMLFVGLFFTLLCGLVLPLQGKLSPGILAVLGILMAVTAKGYGTFIWQLNGRFFPLTSTGSDIPVPGIYGWFWLFITGFGWVALFATVFGMVLSSKPYRGKDLVVVILVFYLFFYLMKLTLAPISVPLLAPITTEIFRSAVGDLGLTPWQFTWQHFFDAAAYVPIEGGRNYEAQITNLSAVLAAIFLSLFLWIRYRDGRAARTAFMVNLIFGIGMMAAAVFQFLGRGGLYVDGTPQFVPPEWFRQSAWSFWEFFTGFLSISGTFAFMFHELKTPITPENSMSPLFGAKAESFLWRFGYLLGLFGFSFGQLLGGRIALVTDSDMVGYLVQALCVIITGGCIILTNRRKLPLPAFSSHEYAFWAIFILLPISTVIYFFLHSYGGVFLTRAVHVAVAAAFFLSIGILFALRTLIPRKIV